MISSLNFHLIVHVNIDLKGFHPRSRLEVRKILFSSRVIGHWNNFSPDTLSSSSLEQLKRRLASDFWEFFFSIHWTIYTIQVKWVTHFQYVVCYHCINKNLLEIVYNKKLKKIKKYNKISHRNVKKTRLSHLISISLRVQLITPIETALPSLRSNHFPLWGLTAFFLLSKIF